MWSEAPQKNIYTDEDTDSKSPGIASIPFFFFFCAFKMPLFKLKSPGFLSKIYTLFRFSKIQVDKPD